MAQANRYTGKQMVIYWNDVPLHADYKSLTVDEGVNSAESTAGSDSHEFSIPTYTTASIDVELLKVNSADDEYEDIKDEMAPGTEGELVYGPDGLPLGGEDYEELPMFTATGYVEKVSSEYKFDEVATLKFTIHTQAPIEEDVWPDPDE